MGRAAVKGFLFAFSCCYKSSEAARAPSPAAGRGAAPCRPQPVPPPPGLCRDAQHGTRRAASAGPLILLLSARPAPSPLQAPGRGLGSLCPSQAVAPMGSQLSSRILSAANDPLPRSPRSPLGLQGFVHPSAGLCCTPAPSPAPSWPCQLRFAEDFHVLPVRMRFRFESSRTQHFSRVSGTPRALRRRLLPREIDVPVRSACRQECTAQNSCRGPRGPLRAPLRHGVRAAPWGG